MVGDQQQPEPVVFDPAMEQNDLVGVYLNA
jgi:hypothetical protein